MALHIPLRKTSLGQKGTSFLGSKIWLKINPNLKIFTTTTTFTHALKKEIMDNLKNYV